VGQSWFCTKRLTEGKTIAVNIDKKTDNFARSILNMMAIILDPRKDGRPRHQPLLTDTEVLQAVNFATVGQAIIMTVVEYGVQYLDLRLIL
jgi:hypothetical protein